MLLAATLASIPVTRPWPTTRTPHGVCLDEAYDITWVSRLLAEAGFRLTCACCGRMSRHAGAARAPAAG